jgi:cysteine synthase A
MITTGKTSTPPSKLYGSLGHMVGNTPLIQISEKLWAKAELFNPTGSIKDRPASRILDVAEQEGKLKPGMTICEATSGNMGVSFAWLAAQRGYKCVIVMPSNMSIERKKTLELYGAELIEVDPGNFDGAIALRNQLCEENGWFNCNQFGSQENIIAHQETTAEEILKQVNEQGGERIVYEGIGSGGAVQFDVVIGPKISAFVSGTGTGGTLMGAGLSIKEEHPNMKIVAVEPLESPVMSGGEPGLHGIQGIGDGSKFLVDLDKVDEIICIATEDARVRAQRLAKEQGLFVGISAGANILAAEKWIQQNKPDGVVVTFLCDRGDRYFSCL